MRNTILSMLKIVAATFFCAAAANTVAYGDSSTIYANSQFPNTYTLTPGDLYQKGYNDLTYKMIDIIGQTGLFASHEGSIIFINILSVTGLPNGLSWDQLKDRLHPADNTFYIFGTLAADITPGDYPVSVEGEDAAYPSRSHTATQVIILHIGPASGDVQPINVGPFATVTCPTVEQLQAAPGSCPASVTVFDSVGNPHVFVKQMCNGLLWDFHSADVNLSSSPMPNGLSCSYLTSSPPQGVGFVYILDPAPANTYYGSNPSNTTASCTTSIDACTFNIPQ